MKKKLAFSAALISSSLFFTCVSCFSMEKLDKHGLKDSKGQAGLSIGLDGVVIQHTSDAVKFIDAQAAKGYVSLEGVEGLGIFETGAEDLDSNGVAGHLTLDMGLCKNSADTTLDDIGLVFIECPDWKQSINLKIANVNWCGYDLGSMEIKDFSMPSWHAYIGGYNGAGIDLELGFRTRIEEIRFGYGSAGQSLCVKGLAAAGSFSGNPEADPTTWLPAGEFKIGEAVNPDSETNLNFQPNPLSIDCGVRTIKNSENEDVSTAVIGVNLRASGSIRADNIKFGNSDFGQMAIDGIRVNSMKIELPGRGYGSK